jgi:hypothetical protein
MAGVRLVGGKGRRRERLGDVEAIARAILVGEGRERDPRGPTPGRV